MKKIIHVSCLILLLLTCNRIISSNGIAIIPELNLSMVFSIEEASVKLDDLMEQRNRGREIDLHTHDEILNILIAYSSEAKIWIFDKNDKHIGTCDTKVGKKMKPQKKK